jgi:A/G-specific adenine glycosylase
VLLERRPPTGVWARLWSLPEMDNGASAPDHLHERYAVRVDTTIALDRFVHTFSHYHLQVTPLLFTGTPIANRVADDPDRDWYSHGQFSVLGLPAPVRKLLETLEESPWPATSTA